MKSIEEFILERLNDVERYLAHEDMPARAFYRIQRHLNFQRELVEFHKNWPTLVQGPVDIVLDSPVEHGFDPNAYALQISQRLDWLTQEEFRKKFGDLPPTAPLLKKMAEMWEEHSEFNPEW